MEDKVKDIDYIKKVKELTNMKQICLELNVDYANVCSGKTSVKNIKKVADKLKKNIEKIDK